jgi:hypothetical protein
MKCYVTQGSAIKRVGVGRRCLTLLARIHHRLRLRLRLRFRARVVVAFQL